jgi:hypothetical protein
MTIDRVIYITTSPGTIVLSSGWIQSNRQLVRIAQLICRLRPEHPLVAGPNLRPDRAAFIVANDYGGGPGALDPASVAMALDLSQGVMVTIDPKPNFGRLLANAGRRRKPHMLVLTSAEYFDEWMARLAPRRVIEEIEP